MGKSNIRVIKLKNNHLQNAVKEGLPIRVDNHYESEFEKDCETCKYGEMSSPGWCYMFEDPPTERCMQHTPTPKEKKLVEARVMLPNGGYVSIDPNLPIDQDELIKSIKNMETSHYTGQYVVILVILIFLNQKTILFLKVVLNEVKYLLLFLKDKKLENQK